MSAGAPEPVSIIELLDQGEVWQPRGQDGTLGEPVRLDGMAPDHLRNLLQWLLDKSARLRESAISALYSATGTLQGEAALDGVDAELDRLESYPTGRAWMRDQPLYQAIEALLVQMAGGGPGPRSWRMRAALGDVHLGMRSFHHAGHPRLDLIAPREQVRDVLVTENPGDDPVMDGSVIAGDYWGWIPAGEDAPVMIRCRRYLYDAQFTYGPDAEEAAGKGRTVRLSIRLAGS